MAGYSVLALQAPRLRGLGLRACDGARSGLGLSGRQVGVGGFQLCGLGPCAWSDSWLVSSGSAASRACAHTQTCACTRQSVHCPGSARAHSSAQGSRNLECLTLNLNPKS